MGTFAATWPRRRWRRLPYETGKPWAGGGRHIHDNLKGNFYVRQVRLHGQRHPLRSDTETVHDRNNFKDDQ